MNNKKTYCLFTIFFTAAIITITHNSLFGMMQPEKQPISLSPLYALQLRTPWFSTPKKPIAAKQPSTEIHSLPTKACSLELSRQQPCSEEITFDEIQIKLEGLVNGEKRERSYIARIEGFSYYRLETLLKQSISKLPKTS